MKYIQMIATLLVLLYIAHLSDRIYVEMLKPILNELTGISYIGYAFITWTPRFLMGWMAGKNLDRINNWIWGL